MVASTTDLSLQRRAKGLHMAVMKPCTDGHRESGHLIANNYPSIHSWTLKIHDVLDVFIGVFMDNLSVDESFTCEGSGRLVGFPDNIHKHLQQMFILSLLIQQLLMCISGG